MLLPNCSHIVTLSNESVVSLFSEVNVKKKVSDSNYSSNSSRTNRRAPLIIDRFICIDENQLGDAVMRH